MNATMTARRLRQVMAEKNLRQVDIVNLCKPYCRKYGVQLTKSHLSQYLAGKFSPRQDKLTILSMALGVSEAWLMGYCDVEEDELPIKEDELMLTSQEEDMIRKFRSLNREGQAKAVEYISDIIMSNRYTQDGVDKMVGNDA